MDNANIIRITANSLQLIRAYNANIISTAELLDMVGQVNYIKLDSSEPIGEISKMVVTRDKIFILDAHIAQQIFVFNRISIFPPMTDSLSAGKKALQIVM